MISSLQESRARVYQLTLGLVRSKNTQVTVFYDAASKYVCMELQVGYTAVEMIKSKSMFEWMAANIGVQVHAYHMDNGIYCSDKFLKITYTKKTSKKYKRYGPTEDDL